MKSDCCTDRASVQGRRSRSPLFALVLFVCLLGLSACHPVSTQLKLGTLLPITGDLSAYGSSMQDTARFLVSTVNGCGGVLGQPVDLVAEDDQTEPAAGASAMTKLAEVDRVAGVVGAASSGTASAEVDIAVRNQVILISPSSTSPVFSERSRRGEFQGFWFRTAPPDTFQSKALAQLAKTRGVRSVAVLAINNDYGNGILSAFIPAFEAIGGTVVNKANPTRYPPDSSTFDSIVSAGFRDNPDAVLLIAYPETGSLILKAAYQQGLLAKALLLATDGMKEAGIADLVGKTAQGQYLAAGMVGTAPSAGGPALKQFQERYAAQFRRTPKIFDPNTWDAAALIVLAAEAAKSTSATAIKDLMRDVANPPGESVTDVCQGLSLLRAGRSINYEGASGSVDLNDVGDVTGRYDVWTIAPDGSLKVIDAIAVTEK
ncbi:ABC transporter substrate-binding protein [Leptolyngbya sp. FACHB-36]|uniref:ABC transporter substrate-binding protein n=1 Tax=Leptolyngbya sp. FACHB-36 TaxID=2692808 RepID=UPI001681A257|nr:ABC transporter substrate-binding protein [Leptolyngbya sp. FACHB-36]MBD2022732.1 ABC transporter substrate-binding protein [Leptolyngbya sp. FACHB-36]